MNVYSNTKPALVSNKTLKTLGKKFRIAKQEQIQWNESMENFYVDYIQPNLFALIVFVLLFIFLTIRYVLKIDNDNKKDRDRNNNKKIDKTSNDTQQHMYEEQYPYLFDDNLLKDEFVDDTENTNNMYSLEKEYQSNMNNNNGYMSDNMMKDIYNTKTSKLLFNEMARVVSGND